MEETRKEKKLKYVGWALTDEAKGKAIAKEVRRMRPVFSRAVKLAQLRSYGYSGAEIARRHHLSRERVRQVLEHFDRTFILMRD